MSEPKRELSIDELKAFSETLKTALVNLSLVIKTADTNVRQAAECIQEFTSMRETFEARIAELESKDPAKGGYIPADKPIKAHLSAGEEVWNANDVKRLGLS